jgi:transposase
MIWGRGRPALGFVDVGRFIRDGYAAIRGAVDAETVAACRELIWESMAGRGVRREDPATWPPLAEIDDLGAGPFAAAGMSPALTAAYDELIGPHRYEPDVNATYAEMAAHYGMAVIPARAYKPRDKAKAESGVLLAERWIIARLRDRRFFSVSEANAAIAGCVAEINARPFQKMDGSRRSLFESLERPALRPLPPDRYEFATWRQARVNIDYHIEADRHYYSVPYQLAGQQVDVRLSAATVEVFHSSRRVASHPRSSGRHRHSTDTAHMPESHRRHAEWTPSRIIDWAAKTGPATAGLVQAILASRPHPEQGYRSALGIIRLAGRHGPGRVEAACARALHLSVLLLPQRRVDPEALPGPPAAARRPPGPARPSQPRQRPRRPLLHLNGARHAGEHHDRGTEGPAARRHGRRPWPSSTSSPPTPGSASRSASACSSTASSPNAATGAWNAA